MFKWIKEHLAVSCYLTPVVIGIFLPFACMIHGCVDHSEEIRQQKYEHVKTAAGKDLFKVQVFCPGKTLTYVSSSVRIFSSNEAEFIDYMTNERVNTTCPVVSYPILRMKVIPTDSGPQDLDELLKIDVVGMMAKGKTPIEQVPVVEESKKQPSSPQNNITINNYSK